MATIISNQTNPQPFCIMAKLSVFYDFNNGNAASWHFGSLDAAYDSIEKQIEADTEHHIMSYSVEEEQYIPCDANKPNGKLYIGCNHFNYVEVNKK